MLTPRPYEERNKAMFAARQNGETYKEIADKFGLSQGRVRDICERIKWLGGERYYVGRTQRRKIPLGTSAGKLQSVYSCECIICGANVSGMSGTRDEVKGQLWQKGWTYHLGRWHCEEHTKLDIEAWWWVKL